MLKTTCISPIPRARLFSYAQFSAFSGFLISNSVSLLAAHPCGRQRLSRTRSVVILRQFSSSSFLHLSIRRPFRFAFQNKSPLNQVNRTTWHLVIQFRMPPFGATPGRGPPRNRPHFWYGKLVNVPLGCSETYPIPPARCTRSPHRVGASASRNQNPRAPHARCPATNYPGYRNGIAPSGFARTIARAEIHGAQSYVRTVRTLDISLAGTSRVLHCCAPATWSHHPRCGTHLRQTQPRTCGLCCTDPAELCAEPTRHCSASNVADADDRTSRGPVTMIRPHSPIRTGPRVPPHNRVSRARRFGPGKFAKCSSVKLGTLQET